MSAKKVLPPKKRVHKDPLCRINKPSAKGKGHQSYDRIALVLQGGGALGAFQVGAYKAILEKGYTPNYFSGVSIGAINCAIIAGNPREKQLDRLFEFWDTIAPRLWHDYLGEYVLPDYMLHWRNQMGAMHAILHGLEGFFEPRSLPPHPLTRETPDKLSYYDTSCLKTTLEKLIDFDRINDKLVTLCLGAVNVGSGEMEFFNNQKILITPEHVMASGALPPGFPAIKIGDEYYWDGGIYANTPLVTVLDALPELDTLCFVVDCFSLRGRLPKTMDELEERQKDIRYASHSKRLTNIYTSRQNLQAAIKFLGDKLSADAKKDPEVQKILALGHSKKFSVVHIIYHGTPFGHSFKDYNFLRSAIHYRMHTGYYNATQVLEQPYWHTQSKKTMACSIYGVNNDYFEQH